MSGKRLLWRNAVSHKTKCFVPIHSRREDEVYQSSQTLQEGSIVAQAVAETLDSTILKDTEG
jgi:hypothetical protein